MNDKDFEKLASTFGFAPSRALRELLDAATAQAALDERERLSAENMTVLALQQRGLMYKKEDLYWRLYALSEALEGSDRIDQHEHPDAYATILDAMNLVRQAKP